MITTARKNEKDGTVVASNCASTVNRELSKLNSGKESLGATSAPLRKSETLQLPKKVKKHDR